MAALFPFSWRTIQSVSRKTEGTRVSDIPSVTTPSTLIAKRCVNWRHVIVQTLLSDCRARRRTYLGWKLVGETTFSRVPAVTSDAWHLQVVVLYRFTANHSLAHRGCILLRNSGPSHEGPASKQRRSPPSKIRSWPVALSQSRQLRRRSPGSEKWRLLDIHRQQLNKIGTPSPPLSSPREVFAHPITRAVPDWLSGDHGKPSRMPDLPMSAALTSSLRYGST